MNLDFRISGRSKSWDETSAKLMRHHSWAAVAGAAVTVGGALLKPKAKAGAMAAPIDLTEQQGKSITGNLRNEGDIEHLISQANTFTQGQASDLMEKAMPGYGKLAAAFTQTAQEDLAHPYDVPKDVTDNLERLAAERGISGGTRGQFNDFSLLRDFGVNSLTYGQSKIAQAQSITSMLGSLAPKVNPLSPLSFYVTPGQQAQVAAGNASNQQASNNAQAAASNYNNDNLWGAVTGGVGSIVGSAFAQSGGGGGGGSGVNTGNLVTAPSGPQYTEQ